MATKVTMPQLGESVVEGTVGKWLVKVGDRVEQDQPIVEILTDKADSELPAPTGGVVVRILAAEDEVVTVGATLCEIDETATASVGAPAAPAPAPEPRAAAAPAPTRTATEASAPTSPAIRKLAREQDIDLGAVRGTGSGGRITKADLEAAASTKRDAVPPPPSEPVRAPAPAPVPAARAVPVATAAGLGAFRLPPYVEQPGDQIVPFTRRRRIIADHMVFSKQTSPEVVTFAECDLHKTSLLRDRFKDQYKKEGVGLSFLAFTLAATARALREFPELNARVLEDAYVKLRDVNLGIAVDTPQGLVVPVIKNADELTVRGLARAVADLAEKARTGDLTPDMLANKTFTVSNPGLKGNLVGGAIISQPNVGILRLGTIKKRPVVIEKDGEDLIAIHPVMYMALTYDHRIVDGVHANGFLYRIGEILEQGDFEL